MKTVNTLSALVALTLTLGAFPALAQLSGAGGSATPALPAPAPGPRLAQLSGAGGSATPATPAPAPVRKPAQDPTPARKAPPRPAHS